MFYRLTYLVLLALLLASCAPGSLPLAATPTSGPYGMSEPFIKAWQDAGGEGALGAPLGAARWIDEYQVQFFATASITAIDTRRAVLKPLATDWQSSYPVDLLSLPVAPLRASILLADPHNAVAQPLVPITVTLRLEGYTGLVELRLFDGDLRPAGSITLEVTDGQGKGRQI
ncbi:MAG: hypothetical protein HGA65_10085, partial [Oscillochloris sp.]|nr:hypothetical protein [Oscillochloris sp.]